MKTILFLCPHGGAKSVIAASYFNRLAREGGLPFVAAAAAAEDPYGAVPEPVAAMLHDEGFDVHSFRPRRAEAGEIDAANRIVSIDCDPATLPAGRAGVEEWTDVPMASEDLPGSASAIRRHVAMLMEQLRAGR